MSSFENYRSIHLDCLGILMRPLVRFCLSRSQSYQDFVEVAKGVFVEIAEEESKRDTGKANASRISAMTGINRGEVMRLYNKDGETIEKAPSILGRVIGQWEQRKDFQTKTGRPKVLDYKGEDSEFHKLVYSVSAHLNPGTILRELERIGVVKKTDRSVRLQHDHLITAADPRKTLKIVAMDFQTLLDSALENIKRHRERVKNHHQRTEYNNIYAKDVPQIREWLWKEGKKFHKRARDFISQFDKDVVPPPSFDKSEEWRAGVNVVLCAHSRVSLDPSVDSEEAVEL